MKLIKEMNMQELGAYVCDALEKKIKPIMIALGFSEYNRYFIHPDTKLFIEFPKGPLVIGNAPVKEISTRENGTGLLRLLTPTDCIKDRLAAYYYWDDLQSLKQAVWVAKQNIFNIQDIKTWSKEEGELSAFLVFEKKLLGDK